MTTPHEIVPFESFDNYTFGADKASLSQWGEPDSTEDDDIMEEFRAHYGSVTLIFERPEGQLNDTTGQRLAEVQLEGNEPVRVAGFNLSDDDDLTLLLATHTHREEKRYILIPNLGLLLYRFRLKDRTKRGVFAFVHERLEFAAAVLDVQ